MTALGIVMAVFEQSLAHALCDAAVHLAVDDQRVDRAANVVDMYPLIAGQADTETLFYLALTLGLEDDPPQAVAKTIGLIERVGRDHGVRFPFQGTIATSEGERIWAFRYSSEGKSRSLFFSKDVDTLRSMYPEREILRDVGEDARLIVSEPVGDLPGAWNELPESSYGLAGGGEDALLAFTPVEP